MFSCLGGLGMSNAPDGQWDPTAQARIKRRMDMMLFICAQMWLWFSLVSVSVSCSLSFSVTNRAGVTVLPRRVRSSGCRAPWGGRRVVAAAPPEATCQLTALPLHTVCAAQQRLLPKAVTVSDTYNLWSPVVTARSVLPVGTPGCTCLSAPRRYGGPAGEPVSVVTALGWSSEAPTLCGQTGRPEELRAVSLLHCHLWAASTACPPAHSGGFQAPGVCRTSA